MKAFNKVAVIGNGAASIAMVLKLVAEGFKHVEWYGGESVLNEIRGLTNTDRPYGIAYRTNNPGHLLNAPVSAMGIGAVGKLDDFAHFIAYRLMGNGPLNEIYSMYASRSQYRQYLRWCLTIAGANKLFDYMRAVEWKGHASIDDVQKMGTDTDIVLCVGASHKTVDAPFGAQAIQNPWDYDYERVRDVEKVTILGSGLTALDTARSVWDVSPDAHIKFISRNGRFPLAHRPNVKPMDLKPYGMSTMGLLDMLHTIRYLSERNDWQAVMNGLRNEWKNLWPVLSIKDKVRFLRIQPFWEIHRHRMIPDAQNMLDEHSYSLIKSKKADTLDYQIGTLFNATGVDTDPRSNPLLNQMIDQRMIKADPNFPRLGLAADQSCKVGHGIWCVGAHMRATRWEATAMSDIVDMVNIVAQQLKETA